MANGCPENTNNKDKVEVTGWNVGIKMCINKKESK